MKEMVIRYPFLMVLYALGMLDELLARADFTVIGLSGYVSAHDDLVAKERNLKPLNRFELWLLKPIIEDEQIRRRVHFRHIMRDEFGEDFDTSWP
jgi:hypothetical protein